MKDKIKEKLLKEIEEQKDEMQSFFGKKLRNKFSADPILEAKLQGYNLGVEETKKAERERFEKIIENLNEKFRKDNTPQRLSGDEFNDLWEDELKKELEKEE